MRLWHQSFTELDRLPAYKQALEAHLSRVAHPDTEVDLYGMQPGTYETEYPGIDIRYAAIQAMHKTQILEHVIRAEDEGYDGFLLNTMPDPGLTEARTLVDIPVIGYGQSSMHVAGFLGDKFGIVCFIEGLIPLYAENARRYGLGANAGPVRPLGLTFHDVVAGYERPEPVLSAFQEVVRGMAREGVNVVIPGEAPLSLLLQRCGVSRIDHVAVVDTLGVSVKMAESLVSLRRTSGMAPAAGGYFFDHPPRERMKELFRYYRRERSA